MFYCAFITLRWSSFLETEQNFSFKSTFVFSKILCRIEVLSPILLAPEAQSFNSHRKLYRQLICNTWAQRFREILLVFYFFFVTKQPCDDNTRNNKLRNSGGKNSRGAKAKTDSASQNSLFAVIRTRRGWCIYLTPPRARYARISRLFWRNPTWPTGLRVFVCSERSPNVGG